MAGLTRRIWNTLTGQTEKGLVSPEGSWRGPFAGIGELGGQFLLGSLEDGWQRNLSVDKHGARHIPACYASVMAIARAISQCYPVLVVEDANGGVTRPRNRPAYRVLNRPNSYQTSTQFMLNMVATALFEGESFSLSIRNDRNDVIALHQITNRNCTPRVDSESGEIFYAVGTDPLYNNKIDFVVPARDITHLRFHTPRHPLIGESPLAAAGLAMGVNVALSRSQAAFYSQMNRPSGILSTDQTLNKEQMLTLRDAFNEQSKLWAQGGVPILANGLGFQQLSISSQDAQMIEAQKMSIHDICRVYGVPPPLIGELSDASLNNAETLIQHFLSISLGSYIENVERAFDRTFNLSVNEYIELDVNALLRTNFGDRIAGLTKGVQGGLFTPNEARAREGFGPVDGGDTAYLQRQMVPINAIDKILEAEAERATAQQQQPAASAAEPNDEPDPETTKALVVNMLEYKRKAA